MMRTVEQIIDEVIEREGGDKFTDNPNDPGGATRFGITQRTAQSYGYFGRMQDLPRDLAVRIYRDRFVVKPGFDKVLAVEPSVAIEMIDTGVNCGPARPGPWLQRCLNEFNRQGVDYSDITVDGAIGPATLGALRAFLLRRGEQGRIVMLRALNSLQGVYYLDVAASNVKLEDFTFGWFLNRVEFA